MRGGGALVVVCAMVGTALLAACSESGDAGSVTSATASTTTPAPSTDPPDTTGVETTAAPTTSDASTTDAPTTTLDDDATLAAVEQAYLDGRNAYLAAVRDPGDPELRAAIRATYVGPNLDFTLARLDSFVANGWVALPSSDVQSQAVLLQPAEFLPGSSALASLEACEIDSERIVEVGGAPDGSDALVTDEVLVEHVLVRLELVDGDWRSHSGEVLDVLASPSDCVSE